MESYEERRPEEIERDIERTRSQMAGTLDDIQRQFSPGQMVDQALGYLNEKSGKIGHQVMDTIRENPVPVTLIGVGLAWLATSGWSGSPEYRGSRYSATGSRMSGGQGYGTSGTRSRTMAGTAGYGGGYGGYGATYGTAAGSSMPEHAMGERAVTERRIRSERRTNGSAGVSGAAWTGPNGEPDRRRGERRVRHMGQGMEHLGQRIGETMGEARHGMGEAMDTMTQKASETAGQVRQKTGQVLGQVREKAGEWTEQAREKTHELTDEARERAEWIGRKLQDQTRYIIEEQPLVLAALGIAIGSAIGATLPRTREEDRLMGPARDELLHRADETGGELIREAREQVKSGMESLTSGMASGQQGQETGRRETERAESSPTTPSGGGEPRRP